MAQTGELNARERRFTGWFGFDFRLPDGRHPAELAALDLVKDAGITELTSVTKFNSRHEICHGDSHNGNGQ